jgi:hypothetical protein
LNTFNHFDKLDKNKAVHSLTMRLEWLEVNQCEKLDQEARSYKK